MAKEHIYPLSRLQAEDVARWLRVFSEADSDDAPDGVKWGEGARAILGLTRIPIHSDAHGYKELLGWIEQGDFGWTFTQISTTDTDTKENS